MKKDKTKLLQIIKFCWDCAEKWYRKHLGYPHPWDFYDDLRRLVVDKNKKHNKCTPEEYEKIRKSNAYRVAARWN